jgi:serine/threonine protein kinase
MTKKPEVFCRTFSASPAQAGQLPLRTYRPIVKPVQQPEQDPLIGTVVGHRYQVLSVVSRGGMGVIYRCRQSQLDRTVALKLLPFELIEDPVVVDRFQREAKVLSRLSHSNLTTLYDFGRLPTGEPFFVLEYVDGETLDSLLKREGQLDYRRVVPIFTQICNALGYAHQLGVIHRDIKPQNIMLVSGQRGPDFVKVLDFGIVKLTDESRRLTRMGEVWGTAIYMSPEQCTGQPVDSRSDIFSLGSVLYESLTGQHPFNGKNLMQIMTKLMNEQTPPFKAIRPDLSIPPAIEEVVGKALRKQPNDRFNSMEELSDALQGALAAPQAIASQPTAPPAPPEDLRYSHKISAQTLGIQAGGIIPQTDQQTPLPDAAQFAAADRAYARTPFNQELQRSHEMTANQRPTEPQPAANGEQRLSSAGTQAESAPPVYGYSRARNQAPPTRSRPGQRPPAARNGSTPNVPSRDIAPYKLFILITLLAVAAFGVLVAIIKATHPEPSTNPHPHKQSARPSATFVPQQQLSSPGEPDLQAARSQEKIQQPDESAPRLNKQQTEQVLPVSSNLSSVDPRVDLPPEPLLNPTASHAASKVEVASTTKPSRPSGEVANARKRKRSRAATDGSAGGFTDASADNAMIDGLSPPVVRDDQTQWWRFKQRLESASQPTSR